MIVSENGQFLNMELPKRGTSMAPFVVRPDVDLSKYGRKVRQNAKFKDEGVLMKPKNFKAWASKLDKLKQVVRVSNLADLNIHQSSFTMTKRRALTVDKRPSVNVIQSQCVNLKTDEDSLDDMDDEDSHFDLIDTQQLHSPKGEEQNKGNDDAAIPNDEDDTQDNGSSNHTFVVNNKVHSGDTWQKLVEESIMSKAIVANESCLGYLYPRKLDVSGQKNGARYGSKLGPIHYTDSNHDVRQRNVPPSSNLESLLTYPKKLHSKSGALLGFGNLKYPKSAYELFLRQKQAETSTQSINIQPQLQAQQQQVLGTGRGVSSMSVTQNLGSQPGGHHNSYDRKVSEDLAGWEAGNPTSDVVSRMPSSSVVTSTRIGGATFVKNQVSAIVSPMQGEQSLTGTQTSSQLLMNGLNESEADAHQQQLPAAKKKVARYNRSQPNLKSQQRKRKQSHPRQPIDENQTPLQLANLSVLMANLEKSGNFQQANEEAFKMRQAKLSRGGPSQQRKREQSLSTIVAKIGENANSTTSSNEGMDTFVQPIEEGRQTFYITDHAGNVMKVSKSTIFEISNDVSFMRMAPTLTLGGGQDEKDLASTTVLSNNPMAAAAAEAANQEQQVKPNVRKTVNHHHRVSPDVNARVVSLSNNNMSAMSHMTSGFGDQKPSTTLLQNSALDEAKSSHNESQANLNSLSTILKAAAGPHSNMKSPAMSLLMKEQQAHLHSFMNEQPFQTLSSQQKQKIYKGGQQWPTHGSTNAVLEDQQKGLVIRGDLKQLNQKNNEPQKRIKDVYGGGIVPEDPRQSNDDLQQLDPPLTALQGQRRQNKQQTFNLRTRDMNESVDNNPITSASQRMAKSPRDETHDSIKWKALPSTKPILLDYDQRNEIANASFGPVSATSSGLVTHSREQIAIQRSLHSQGTAKRQYTGQLSSNQTSSRQGTVSNLPTMLQNMKYQMESQVKRQNSKTTPTNPVTYGVIGRQVSPQVDSRRSNSRTNSREKYRRRKSKDQGSNTKEFHIKQAGSSLSGTIIPIVITNSGGEVDEKGIDPKSPDSMTGGPHLISNNQTMKSNGTEMRVTEAEALQPHESAKIQKPQSKEQMAIVFKNLDKSLSKGNPKRKKNAANQQIRFTDENSAEVVTENGDQAQFATGFLGRVNDGRSRDQLAQHGDTIKLDGSSSVGVANGAEFLISKPSDQQLIKVENERNYSFDMAEMHSKQEKLKQSATTQRTIDEVSRQTIPITGVGVTRTNGVTPQQSGVSIGNTEVQFHLKSIEDSKNNSPERANEYDVDRIINFDKSAAEQEDGEEVTSLHSPFNNKHDGSSSPTDGLANFSLRHHHQISKSTSPAEVLDSHLSQRHPTTIIGRTTATIAFKKKNVAKNETGQNFVQQKQKLHHMRFNNTTISSVNIGMLSNDNRRQMSPRENNVRGFLPTMPFKMSSFARTQKAIKKIRQGPTGRGRHTDNNSGQFMGIKEYAQMQANQQDAKMYLRPEDSQTSGMPQESGPYASDTNKRYGETAHSSIEDQNHVTATSFMPPMTKQDSLLKKRSPPFRSSVGGSPKGSDDAHHVGSDYLILQLQEQSDQATVRTPTAARDDPQMLHHQFNTGVRRQETTQLPTKETNRTNDYVTTQRQKDLTSHGDGNSGVKIYSADQSHRGEPGIRTGGFATVTNLMQKSNEEDGRPPNTIISAHGSITIKRNSQDSKDTTSKQQQQQQQLNQSGKKGQGRRTSTSGSPSPHHQQMMPPASQQAIGQRQRQVVIHKLTMASSNENSRQIIVRTSGGQETEIAKVSPSNQNSFIELDNNGVSREPSVTEMTTSQYLGVRKLQQSKDAVQASKFANLSKGRGHAASLPKYAKHQQAPQGKSNIINLSAMPPIQSSNKELFIGNRNDGNLDLLASAASTTAHKFMTNAETKARIFIEKQRKRTATLGIHRPQLYKTEKQASEIYSGHVSPEPAAAMAFDQSNQRQPHQKAPAVAQKKNGDLTTKGRQSVGMTDFASPPVVDITGDSLYDSGLMIQRSQMNQAKYLQNRQQQQLQQQKIFQGSSSLQKTASGGSMKEVSPGDSNAFASAQSSTVTAMQGQAQIQMRQMTISRVNHNVLNQNPRLIGSQHFKDHSPTRLSGGHGSAKKSQSPDLGSTSLREKEFDDKDQLYLTGNVVNVIRRQGTQVESAPDERVYGDYLRGNTEKLSETQQQSAVIRAKTPVLESSTLAQIKILQNRKKGKMISQPSNHVMSNETLGVAKSAVMTSDGMSHSRTNKSKIETPAKVADSSHAPIRELSVTDLRKSIQEE